MTYTALGLQDGSQSDEAAAVHELELELNGETVQSLGLGLESVIRLVFRAGGPFAVSS